MTPEEKKQLEVKRQSTGIKVMTYNRFLLIRYVGACLFFINLYTALLYLLSHSNLIILPILLIFAQLPAIWEQIKLYSTPVNVVKFTQSYRKCGIEPQESTRIFSSISPPQKPESAYCIALCSHL